MGAMPKPLPSRKKDLAVQQLLGRAMDLHRMGILAEAEQVYLQILETRPRQFEAQHLLGVLRGQQGRLAEALELVGAALRTKPDSAVALSDHGLILHKMKRHAEAIASFDRALEISPDHGPALSNRGNVLSELGRFEDALASYDRALKLRPDYAEALNNRGHALSALNRHEQALASYDRAVAIRPGDAQAHYHRGNVLCALNRYDAALASYDKALAIKPDQAQALDNRGNALAMLGRYEEAVASYDKALAIEPHYAGALNNRGTALEELRRYVEALASYDRALTVDPGYAEAFSNRGNALSKLKFYEEAVASYESALAIRSDHVDALYNRGNALAALRRYRDALASYERAMAVSPNDANALAGAAGAALAVCEWSRTAEYAGKLRTQVLETKSTIGPFALLGYSDDPALLLQCARNFMTHHVPVPPPPLWSGKIVRHDRIRLAYLSATFRRHVLAYQIAELLELHDKQRFELIGVSFGGDDQSDVRARMTNACDRFLDVGAQSDRQVAQLLNDLEVDIAVDLMGHTLDARMRIFAHRPAPIQVNYLGYAGTMGADHMDYIIGDPIVLPFEQQPFFTEKIIHLPQGFFANDSKRRVAPNTPSRGEAGLPERGFVFCCFNNSTKILPAMFDIWMRLLHAVEGSVLWLSLRNLDVKANLMREADARGVAPERLVFAPHAPRMEDHLARHRLADLFLDTLPYNAHATASDALWAGLPVLTCCGNTFAARVGASHLRSVGLPELVTHNLADYEALALRLAADPARLGAIRRTLEGHRQTQPLFNTDRLRRQIETAYTRMWDIWQRGERPQSFAVPAQDREQA